MSCVHLRNGLSVHVVEADMANLRCTPAETRGDATSDPPQLSQAPLDGTAQLFVERGPRAADPAPVCLAC